MSPLTGWQQLFDKFLMAHAEFIDSTRRNLEAQTQALEEIRDGLRNLGKEFPERMEAVAARNRKATLEASVEILRSLRELGAKGTEPLETEHKRLLESIPEAFA